MAMAKLFLDGIFGDDSNSPSSVRITVPNPNYDAKTEASNLTLVGLMTGDVTFSAQNSWGTIISDLTNLQDLGSLMAQSSLISWISASTMCWKGTSPLSIGIEFYLINYKKHLNLEYQLRLLTRMAALDEDPNATRSKDFKVQVHGGYAPRIFQGNSSFYTMGDVKNLLMSGQKNLSHIESENVNTNAKSSIQLWFGHKSKIKNLLLSKISVTESNIEVADQDGGNIKPLYYRVSAQFTGVRPLITTDVDEMFNSIGR